MYRGELCLTHRACTSHHRIALTDFILEAYEHLVRVARTLILLCLRMLDSDWLGGGQALTWQVAC